jgi:HK97 family phage portal protein
MQIRIFGKQLLSVKRDLSQYAASNEDYWQMATQRYGVDYNRRRALKAYKNVVYACVSLIGDGGASYQPTVQRKKGDQWETIDHPFLETLKRPNGDPRNENTPKAQSFSQFDLFEATSILLRLQGKVFWYIGKGAYSGVPRQIMILRADKVGTDIDKKTGEITGYFIRQAFGEPIPLEIEEVLEFKLFDPENQYDGRSTVVAANDYIGTDEATAAFTKNFFQNNAGMSGVLNVKGEITKGAFKKFARAFREKYQGVDNAGKVAILRDSDAHFEKIGLGLDEIDMASLRKMTLAEVAMMFRVPLELTGKITEGAGLGRGNIETLEYIFAKWNIDKMMIRFDNVLLFALNRYYPDTVEGYRIIHENIIPEDKEHELESRKTSVDIYKTRNEIRDEDGLDSLPGGDQLFVPAMQIPINEASAAATDTSNAFKGIRIKRIISEPAKKKDLTKQSKERFRITLMRNQARYERQYKKTLKPVFNEQRKEALTNLEAHASSLIAKGDQKLFDDAKYDALMVEKLTPVLTDLAQTQGALALVFAGDDENEFHLTSKILQKITVGTRKMASKYNDDTMTKLNVTLSEGIQAGEGLGELKKRVSDVYDDVTGYRAERIARTETLKASNGATVDAYRQTGFVTQKQWYVNPDACVQCEYFDGKTVPLDDSFLGLGESYTVEEDGDSTTFTNDYDTVEEPPLHPNCRCTIIPVR